MFIQTWIIVAGACAVALLLAWTLLLSRGRNPLPFPDPGSRIFAARSIEAKEALVELLRSHGLKERFQMDSSGIRRSILFDGTIINVSPPATLDRLDGASSCIGLVADDPEAAAKNAAAFLKRKGFDARVVLDVEPNLPIAFVVTDAFVGTALNFRKHVTQMPRPQ